MNTLRILLGVASILLTQQWVLGQSLHPKAIKLSPGSIFTQHVCAEIEWYAKGRMGIALRAAAIRPNLRENGWPAEGFFLKGGPKFYFNPEEAKAAKGWALQVQGVFSYWRDWSQHWPYASGETYRVGGGLLLSLSYGWKPFEHVLIEPSIALGSVPVFANYYYISDFGGEESHRVSWHLANRSYGTFPSDYESIIAGHLSLSAWVAMSGGLQVGIQF